MKRNLLLFVMALCMLPSFCIAFAVDGPMFSDVSEGHWAYDEIKGFAEKGIVNGMEDGSFQPGGNVTREQFAKMLVLTFGKGLEQGGTHAFSDVPAGSWSYGYVEAVKDYFPGYSENGELKFKPRVPTTREDIASALVRLLGISATSPTFAEDTFSDAADITVGLEKFVSAAAEKGLVNGYADGTFKPQGNITRAETVMMLSRALEQFPQENSGQSGQPEEPEDVVQPGKIEDVGQSEKTEASKDEGPTVVITKLPETVDTDSVKVEGTVTDKSGEKTRVTVNGVKVTLSFDGEFSKKVSLKEGKNEILVVAKNSSGKTVLSNEVTYIPKPDKSQKDKAEEKEEFWGFLTDTPYSVMVGNEKGYELNVWNGAENRVVMVDTRANLDDEMPKGSVGYFTMNPDGSALVSHYNGQFGALTGISGNELQIEFRNSIGIMEKRIYEYDSDTIVMNAEKDGTGVPGSDINYKAKENGDGTFMDNVYFVDYNGNLACIIVSVDGEWDL